MFIIVDGIDGSGKGTIVDAMAAALRRKGRRVFDLRAYWKSKHTFPTANELIRFDVIISAEPTHAWVGAAIRSELVRSDAYDPSSLVDAYALDREILYRRLIIPLRRKGKLIIQERGVPSTLAYQVTQGASVRSILNRTGNRLAMTHSPDYLILATLDVETALRRLAARTGKRDGAIFERRAFLTKLARRYASPAYRRLFRSRIIELPTADSINATRHAAASLITKLS